VQPGIVSPSFVSNTMRFAVPLAILAACQTMTMLTGGIDLSVGMVASAAAYLAATQAGSLGDPAAIVLGLAAAAIIGLMNGIGVGIFRVHPLIMTLGVSLVVLGLMNVYQLAMVQAGVNLPQVIVDIGSGLTFGVVPNSLIVFVPLAAAILIGLRRSGFGRLLFAVGDNPVAARLSGVRAWQVLIALYVLSAVLAGIAGYLQSGLTKTTSLTLVESSVLPSVAAAVIGGTSIMGGRGGYAGSIVGALILTVLGTLLVVLQMPEGLRQILFGSIIVGVAAAYARVTGET
jgi:ribose transport system permease protein